MRDIQKRLVDLLIARRSRYEGLLGRPIVNPLTKAPGFFLTDPSPPGATEEQLDQFVKRAGVPLPPDVRTWLTITNGASGFFGVKPVDEQRDIESAWQLRPEWKSSEWIPVGKDCFGNWYVWIASPDRCGSKAVCFVEALDPHKPAYVVASDTLHFAEFDLEQRVALDAGEKYPWPFDRDFVLSKDPDVAKADIAPLPWLLANR